MSQFYPQAICTLRIRWEDFGQINDPILNKEDYAIDVMPKSINVNINDYTKADEFDVSFDYKDFPFDPRCIRACGITIHIEDKKQTFITNQDSPNFNNLNHIKPTKENTIFQGFADEQSIDFNQETREIRMKGRDFTSIFIDAPYPGEAQDLSGNLLTIVQNLVSQLPAAGELVVENRAGVELPVIASFASDKTELGSKRSSKKKETYWEVIKDLVFKSALICYIELDKLVITKPRNLYDGASPYQFIYGNNLLSLSFSRNLGRKKGQNIVVRSLTIEENEVITVKIPEDGTVEWGKDIGVPLEPVTIEKFDKDGKVITPQEAAPYISFNVKNARNFEHLREIGQSVYEEIGRQQLAGSMATKEMCIIQDQGVEFDITKIRNGTAVKIEIDQGDLDGMRRYTTESQRTAFLISRCYEPEIARAFARTMGKFETRFYTRAVQFSITIDGGFDMSLDFVNFIELDNSILS